MHQSYLLDEDQKVILNDLSHCTTNTFILTYMGQHMWKFSPDFVSIILRILFTLHRILALCSHVKIEMFIQNASKQRGEIMPNWYK